MRSLGKNFNLFWLGQTVSFIGDGCTRIAVPMLVLQTAAGPAHLSFMAGTVEFGRIVATLFGTVVDRFDKRRLLMICDAAQMLACASVPLVWWMGGARLWPLYAIAGATGLLGGFAAAITMSLVPDLVGREQMVAATGRLDMSFAVGGVLGPLLVGELAARTGPATALGVDSMTFLLSFLALASVRPLRAGAAAVSTPEERAWSGILVGMRQLLSHPTLRAVSILTMASGPVAGMSGLFVYRVQHDLHQSSRFVGAVFGLAAVGAILGGVSVGAIRRHAGFGGTFLGSMGLCGLAIVAGALVSSPHWLVLPVMLFTFASIVWSTAAISICQQLAPRETLGRTSSVFWLMRSLPIPLGVGLLGLIVARTDAAGGLLCAGVYLVAIALVGTMTAAAAASPEAALQRINSSTMSSSEEA